MVLNNYTINSSGNIVSSSGSKVGFVRVPASPSNSGYVVYNASSTLTRIAYSATQPTTSSTGLTISGLGIVNNAQLSYIVPTNDGYIAFSYTGSPNICVHPSWTGTEDTTYEAYSVSSITIPTKDASNTNLPTASYGMPAVGGTADVLSFDLKTYTQYIGRYAYSAANLATVQAMGVEYDYDSTNIFYVLPTPNTFYLAASTSGVYECSDYGAEWFETSTTVPINAEHLYGQNLRDKLRRDVVTISPMTGDNALTDAQKATFRANIGAASADDVTQLNNDIFSTRYILQQNSINFTNISQINYNPKAVTIMTNPYGIESPNTYKSYFRIYVNPAVTYTGSFGFSGLIYTRFALYGIYLRFYGGPRRLDGKSKVQRIYDVEDDIDNVTMQYISDFPEEGCPAVDIIINGSGNHVMIQGLVHNQFNIGIFISNE